MLSLGAGLAQSIETIKQRLPSFPSWRERAVPAPEPSIDRSPVALAELIEGEIIPRLLVSHRPPRAEPTRPAEPRPIGDGEADAFAALLLNRDVADLITEVDAVLDRGIGTDAVLLDLFAPAARRLGVFWEEDRCDFVDVTMGLWRLQELVHELADRGPYVAPADTHRRALFALYPGEQHSFGLQLVEELFRGSGWETESVTDGDAAALVARVGASRFDLVGLTVTVDEHVEGARALIEALRRASLNPAIVVMAGGRTMSERPELAFAIGADGTASDARRAVARAEFLVETLASAVASRC